MFAASKELTVNPQDKNSMPYLQLMFEEFKKNLSIISNELSKLKELLSGMERKALQEHSIFYQAYMKLEVLFANLSQISKFRDGAKDLFERNSQGDFIFYETRLSSGDIGFSLVPKKVVVENITKMPAWLTNFFAQANNSTKSPNKEQRDYILKRLELFLSWLEIFRNRINKVAENTKRPSDKSEEAAALKIALAMPKPRRQYESPWLKQRNQVREYDSSDSDDENEKSSASETKKSPEQPATSVLVEQLNGEKLSLTKRVDSLDSEKKQLESRLHELEAQLVDTIKQFESKQEHVVQEAEINFTKLSQLLDTARADADQKMSRLQELTSQLANLEKQMSEMREQEIQTKLNFEEVLRAKEAKLVDAEQKIVEFSRSSVRAVAEQSTQVDLFSFASDEQVKIEKNSSSPWYMFFTGVAATATIATAAIYLSRGRGR